MKMRFWEDRRNLIVRQTQSFRPGQWPCEAVDGPGYVIKQKREHADGANVDGAGMGRSKGDA